MPTKELSKDNNPHSKVDQSKSQFYTKSYRKQNITGNGKIISPKEGY